LKKAKKVKGVERYWQNALL